MMMLLLRPPVAQRGSATGSSAPLRSTGAVTIAAFPFERFAGVLQSLCSPS